MINTQIKNVNTDQKVESQMIENQNNEAQNAENQNNEAQHLREEDQHLREEEKLDHKENELNNLIKNPYVVYFYNYKFNDFIKNVYMVYFFNDSLSPTEMIKLIIKFSLNFNVRINNPYNKNKNNDILFNIGKLKKGKFLNNFRNNIRETLSHFDINNRNKLILNKNYCDFYSIYYDCFKNKIINELYNLLFISFDKIKNNNLKINDFPNEKIRLSPEELEDFFIKKFTGKRIINDNIIQDNNNFKTDLLKLSSDFANRIDDSFKNTKENIEQFIHILKEIIAITENSNINEKMKKSITSEDIVSIQNFLSHLLTKTFKTNPIFDISLRQKSNMNKLLYLLSQSDRLWEKITQENAQTCHIFSSRIIIHIINLINNKKDNIELDKERIFQVLDLIENYKILTEKRLELGKVVENLQEIKGDQLTVEILKKYEEDIFQLSSTITEKCIAISDIDLIN